MYRGARLVNWDCVLETAVSDDEIEMVERKDKLYFIQYAIEGQPGRTITVATTRPETMFGDTRIAVNGDDERYRDLVGKKALIPFIGRAIPIPADETVEAKFGTGAVKTARGHAPAHCQRGAAFKLPVCTAIHKHVTPRGS